MTPGTYIRQHISVPSGVFTGGGGHCDMFLPWAPKAPSLMQIALIRCMQFLYITASFLVEVALIHEIGTISPNKTPAIKN